MMKLDVLDESKNAVAMLKARLNSEYVTERLLMDQVNDPYKFTMAQNSLLVNLCKIIDMHRDELMRQGIRAMSSHDAVNLMVNQLALMESLTIDVDVNDVKE